MTKNAVLGVLPKYLDGSSIPFADFYLGVSFSKRELLLCHELESLEGVAQFVILLKASVRDREIK